MKMRTMDSSGHTVEFNVKDERVLAFDSTLRSLFPQYAPRGAARDGDPLFHAIGQLTYLEREALVKMYEPLIYEDLLGPCITSEAGPWAAQVDYETLDRTGRGQRISPSGNNMPFANIVTNKVTLPVAEGGIAYSYTLHDLEASMRGITPLPASKQEAAVIGSKVHLNDVALIGETVSGFTGLLNDANVPNGLRPSGAAWDAATPDTILSDINSALSNVYTNSKQNLHARRLAMPPSRFQRLMQQRSTGSDKTVMTWLQENNLMTTMTGQKLEIVSGGSNLETIGAGGTKRMVAYTPVIERVKMHLPMPIMFGAPQPHMNTLIVPSRYRYGQAFHRMPFAAYCMDGL